MSKDTSNQPQRTSVRPVGYCQSENPENVEVTIYQAGGLAVVREQRRVALIAGPNQVYLEGLPTAYQLNSLTVLDYEGEGELTLGPVSYRAANLDKQRILQASVGRSVVVKETLNNGRVTNVGGTLRAVLGNELAVERKDNHRLMIVPAAQVELEEMPYGLSATPSLMMLPTATKDGDYKLGLMYEAGGLGWTSRYSAFYDEKAGKLTRFEATVAITNRSGARFLNALLKLLAGANYASVDGMQHEAVAFAAAAPMGGAMRKQALRGRSANVESVGDVKVYPLPERVTIEDGETQQVTLFLATDVPVRREYFLSAGGYNNQPGEDADKLPVYLRLRLTNDAASNLGAALPAGEVSILQPDASGAPQKTFTASLQPVAQDEQFKLEFGPSSDIKAERVLIEALDSEAAAEEETEEGGDEGHFPIRPLGGPGMPGDAARDAMREAVGNPRRKADEDTTEQEPATFREEERELTVHNYKAEAVEVVVAEYVPENAEWLKQPENCGFTAEQNGATLRVKVEPKGKTTLRYRVRWQTN